jgi:tetratricopeptide (TPR) repeat protein
MERLLQVTISPAEIAAEIAEKNAVAAKSVNLADVIQAVERHMESEDYFEVLSAIAPVLSRINEDVKLGYFYGVANKGLYQLDEAEKYLTGAYELDPKFYLSAWELALIKMEEKKWEDSRMWLARAEENMSSDDAKYAEYYYYSGVIEFQLKEDFSARSDFTKALWAKDLETSLKGSAAGFLKTLTERKGWGIVVPFGAQYDANVLSLTSSEPVPEVFPGRSLVRSIAGLIFSVDNSGVASKPGTYFGYGAKAMSINNFPRGFSSLDVILADVSLSQSLVSFEKVPADPNKPEGEKTDQKKVTKITQTLGIVVLNSEVASATLSLGLNWQEFEFGAAYEANVAAGVFGKSDAVSLSQAKSFAIAQFETGSIALPVSLKQRYPFTTDASSGLGFTLGIGPTYSHSFSPRLSGNFGVKVEPNYVIADPKGILTLTAGTSLGLTYFITPWFLVLPSLSYDAIRNSQKTGLVHKPGASLLFTALF